MPDNGRPWTQDYFLAEIKRETGWAPAYANYNKLEQGKSQPRPETLDRLVAYWASKGVPRPALTPPEPALSLEERAVVAAERQADALERISVLLAGMVTRGPQADPQADELLARVTADVMTSAEAMLSRVPAPRPLPEPA
jgi:hypothetical protein